MNDRTKIFLLIFFLALGFLFLSQASSFAVTVFNHPQINYDKFKDAYLAYMPVPEAQLFEKSRAPEPSSLLLILGGIVAVLSRLVRRSFEVVKRGMDIFLSSMGLILSAPILLFAAALIKLDSPGPIVYRQKRLGKNRKVFWIYKLRTMSRDAEKSTGAIWAKRDDPRITRVGRFLRKTRIDEIPQLLNVLEGSMSIVGPRPERPEMINTLKSLIQDDEKRLEVKPGITGLAQTLHKYDETIEDVKKKVKYDLLYIKKMGLATDLRIMAQTFAVVLTGKGAH